MNILITGGAGYIGSVTTKRLVELGHKVTVIDNLSKGNKEPIEPQAEFHKIDLLDTEKLKTLFENQKFDSVIHFAAHKDAAESMFKPEKYSENITTTINLLKQIVLHQTPQIIFSSTAAVYGYPILSMDENYPTIPQNFYGYSKLQCEKLIEWYSQLHNFKYVNLRYFNVAGDGGLNHIDPHAKNIFPIIMKVATQTLPDIKIFGNDYDTPDGTGVRDYIHITDLVEAHILALDLKKSETINLGTEKGTTVLELISATEKITNKKIPYQFAKRRPGDPAAATTSFKKAQETLNWQPKKSLEDMIESTYRVYTS